ncbi:hypothetical protein SDC9_183268 [bioreactor metagenome]|uniref:Uncharacterized protein n=1 Tax=bioreactor metagenome TaxID=1076179 RepID=A0A645HCC3_9ZZZZ
MDVRKKNAVSSRLPKGIFENTRGMVLNNNPVPAPGSIPKVNTTGNIAMPASNETIVSDMATFAEVTNKLSSSVK